MSIDVVRASETRLKAQGPVAEKGDASKTWEALT
jgi:hypothetical protein